MATAYHCDWHECDTWQKTDYIDELGETSGWIFISEGHMYSGKEKAFCCVDHMLFWGARVGGAEISNG